MDLARKKMGKHIINTKALLDHFVKELGRELSDDEIKIIKTAYKMGRNQVYDTVFLKKTKKKKG